VITKPNTPIELKARKSGAGGTATATTGNTTLTAAATIGGGAPSISSGGGGGVTDHGALAGLFPDDDHGQYALLAGRAGTQLLIGGTGAGDFLDLQGSSATLTQPVRLLSPLRMAASPNDYIQDSAGNRILTFALDTNVTATTASIAGDLRVNDQLGVGISVGANVRMNVGTWVNLGAGSHNLLQVNLTGTQTANATNKRGFGFLGTYDLGGFTLGSFIGAQFNPTLSDALGTALTNYIAVQAGLGISASPTVTTAAVFEALAANASLQATLSAGLIVRNQGVAGVTTAVGVDIAAQSGATGSNIGLRLNVNFIEGSEMTAPAAPAANGYRIYGEDNGSGKTRLMAIFASGAAQQIAIEP
jgi:hypothetical protein